MSASNADDLPLGHDQPTATSWAIESSTSIVGTVRSHSMATGELQAFELLSPRAINSLVQSSAFQKTVDLFAHQLFVILFLDVIK